MSDNFAFTPNDRLPPPGQLRQPESLSFDKLVSNKITPAAFNASLASMDNLQPLPSIFPSANFLDMNATSGADKTQATQGTTDATAAAGGAAPGADWHAHEKDKWVQDELKNHPDWHTMEGLHPGEIAVGNWEPTKEEKQVLLQAIDKMDGPPRLEGPMTIQLPDGSQAEISRCNGSGNRNPRDKRSDESNDDDDADDSTVGATSGTKKGMQTAGFELELKPANAPNTATAT